jgi:hypothetical protein
LIGRREVFPLLTKDNGLTLVDKQVTGKDCLISAKSCSKLLRQGAIAYVLQLNAESLLPQHPQGTTEQPSPDNSPIAGILQQFDDVFSEPQGLPPTRACDHSILFKKALNHPIFGHTECHIRKRTSSKSSSEICFRNLKFDTILVPTPLQLY